MWHAGPMSAGSAALDNSALHRGAITRYLTLFNPMSGGFPFAQGLPETRTATACCVLGLEFSGELDELSGKEKGKIASFLRRGQQPDGSFRDPHCGERQPEANLRDRAWVVQATTALCQQAFDALLAPPPPVGRWQETWIRGRGIHEHFDSLEWTDARSDSIQVMSVLARLCHDAERHGRTGLLGVVDAGLDWLDAHHSADTGLWEGPHPVSPSDAMAATSHFTFFHSYRRRALKHVERIVDSCLTLQAEHGLFSGSEVGCTCLDYDALDLLAKASVATDHRWDEVVKAMRRARVALLELRNPATGGFVHCRERMSGPRTRFLKRFPLGYEMNRVLPTERSPVEGMCDIVPSLLRSDCADANALSTWLRLVALEPAAGISSRSDRGGTVRFRRLPFPGFHDSLAIRAAERIGQPTVGHVAERSPLVSAIVPAWNEASRLPDALEALRRQSYPRWEAIVVNDGSQDETGQVANAWAAAEPRIRVVHQENHGLPAARNVGLEHARGGLIHCLDADDAVDSMFYEAVMAALGKRGSTSAPGLCAVSRVGLVWETGEIARLDPAPRPEEFEFGKLAGRNIRQPVCHVFERRVLDASGWFDESLAYCEDWDLWLRFARVGVEFLPVHDAVAWYRLRPDSLSSNWAGYLRDGRTVMERALAPDRRCGELGAVHLQDQAVVDEGTARFWAQNLLRAASRGDEAGAKRLFEWGRTVLPEDFWRRPEAYGVRPAFEWAYDAPSPSARSSATMWNLGALFLSLLSSHWPDLESEAGRGAAAGLVSRIAGEIEREDRRSTMAFPRADGISILASHLGWTNPRPLGLWSLLVLPRAARHVLLRLLRRLGLVGTSSLPLEASERN